MDTTTTTTTDTSNSSSNSNNNNNNNNNMIDLIVKTISNESYELLMSSSSYVSELKSIVKESTSDKVAESRQRIIYRGQVLDDNNTLMSYGIATGSVLHMVARPENFEELRRPLPSTPSSSTTASASSDVGDSIPNDATIVNDLLSVLRGRSNISGGSASSIFEGISSSTNADTAEGNRGSSVNSMSLEHTRQGILTLNTILSSFSQNEQGHLVAPVSNRIIPSQRKRYYVGQWIDVKDTVSQWLEATVMALNEENGTIFVHYNGWPTRWDEWIDVESPRVAPFRTRTAHSPLLQHLSPAPSVMLNNAPRTGSDDIRILLPQISNLLHKILPVIDEAANMCNVSVDERNSHGYYTRQLNQSSTSSSNLVSPNMPWPNESSFYERENVTTDLSEAEQQLNLVSSELSPLFDRLGRVMTDLSPHLREIHNRNTPSPLPQTFPDHTFSSLLRTRAPSPPPENRFRELISTSRANGSGRTGSFPGNHLDIHIAILSPSHHVNHSENTISQTVASLALQLQNRLGSQQDLAEDTRARANDESSDSQSGPLLPAFDEDIPDLREENTSDTDTESNNEIKSTNDEENEKDNDNYSYKDNYNENNDDDNDNNNNNDNDNDSKKVDNNSNDNEKHNDNIKCSAKDESIPGRETESRRPLSFLERLRQPLFRR